MSETVKAFIDCMEGDDLTQSVPADKFMERLFGREVDESFMRKMFNAFHSTCPNFKVGEDDCPDCIEKRPANAHRAGCKDFERGGRMNCDCMENVNKKLADGIT